MTTEYGPQDIQAELKAIIERALQQDYEARSSPDGPITGNSYQSIVLGDAPRAGFRSDRHEFLDRLDLGGKKVLDLGSNLGELSRAARQRGAAIVDGFEYDAFFVDVANLVNAYNHTSRVSFFQRDIGDPSSYVEQYDITLAFSVFTFIRPVLSVIAERTRHALVIETHKLEGNLESDYLLPVQKHFPYFVRLGSSEWGAAMDPSGTREVIVFAKSEDSLQASLVDGNGRPRR